MRFRRLSFYGLICLLGLFLFFKPSLISNWQVIPGDPGDGRLNNYFLEHTFQLLTNRRYHGTLFSPTFFYPKQNVLAYSENLFGSAPIYWLFRLFTTAENSFAGWLVSLSVLNFGVMVYVLRRFQVQPVLASLGGFLMAFSLNRAIRLPHAQVFPHFPTPLALLSLWQFLQTPTRWGFIVLLGLTYWQILCSVYLGWFLLFGVIVTIVVGMGLLPSVRSRLWGFFRRNWRFSAAALAVWFGALVALFTPYVLVKAEVGGRTYDEVRTMLPRLSSWFVVPETGTFWSPFFKSFRNGLPMIFEHHIFLGMTIYALTIWAIWALRPQSGWLTTEKRQTAGLFIYSGIALFCLTLVIPGTLISAWWLIYHVVPGASAIRVMGRIALLIQIYWLIGGLMLLDQYLKQLKRPRQMQRVMRACALSALISFAIFEQAIPTLGYDKVALRAPEQELAGLLRPSCQLAYYEMPSQSIGFTYWILGQLAFMWAGIEANVPVINGYSGFFPVGFSLVNENWPVDRTVNWVTQRQALQQGNFCHVQHILPGQSNIATPPANINSTALSYQNTLASTHFRMHVFAKK